MNEKPTIAVFADSVYIKLEDGKLLGLYGKYAAINYLDGEVTHFGGRAVSSLSSDELWEAVREVILERAKDEGH